MSEHPKDLKNNLDNAYVSYIWELWYCHKNEKCIKRVTYVDFNSARSDYIHMSQDLRDDYNWIMLVTFCPTVIKKHSEGQFPASYRILQIYGVPPVKQLFGEYNEMTTAFKTVFGNLVATSKDNPFTKAFVYAKKSSVKLDLCYRDYIAEFNFDNAKYAVLFDIGNGYWNFSHLINKDDVIIIHKTESKEDGNSHVKIKKKK